MVDPLTHRTEWEYDALDRQTLLREADPDGPGGLAAPETTWTYDAASRVTHVENARHFVTQYLYDGLDRVTKVVLPDPDGGGVQSSPEWHYAYDAAGNIVAETDPRGGVTRRRYDQLGRLVETTLADPDGGGSQRSPITRLTYDLASQFIAATDPLGRVTSRTYDRLGRVVSLTQPDPDGSGALSSPVTSFTYDAVGNCLSLTDPVGNATTWTYDRLHRPISETNELDKTRTFAYDAAGNLTQKTDRLGRVTEYVYDGLDRRTTEKWKNGAAVLRTFAWSYDLNGNLTAANDPAASYTFAYDGLDRPTGETQQPAGLPTVQFARQFDAVGNRTRVGATIAGVGDYRTDHTFDGLDRVTQITQQGQGANAVAAKRVDFAHNALGQTTSVARYEDLAGTVNVATTSLSFDNLNRQTQIRHQVAAVDLAKYDYTFDIASRITSVNSLRDGVSQFTYDQTDQLVGEDHANQTDRTYTFDENGNRTMAGHSVGANNRLLSDGVFNYEYDDEGNNTAKVEIATGLRTEYSWDHRNRLTTITSKSSAGIVTKVVDLSYDIFNQWIKRSVDADGPGSATAVDTYFAHEDGQIALEWDDTDGPGSSAPALSHRYLWENAVDQILADEQINSTSTPGNVIWPLTDHLGTIRDAVEVDSSGTVQHVLHRTYNAFGSLTSETNPSNLSAPAPDLLFGFTGRPFDESTGLQNNLHRWYDPVTGKWKSLDPIEFEADDPNLGRYVSNTPLHFTDAVGLAGIGKDNHAYPLYLGGGSNGVGNRFNSDESHLLFHSSLSEQGYPRGNVKKAQEAWKKLTPDQRKQVLMKALRAAGVSEEWLCANMDDVMKGEMKPGETSPRKPPQVRPEPPKSAKSSVPNTAKGAPAAKRKGFFRLSSGGRQGAGSSAGKAAGGAVGGSIVAGAARGFSHYANLVATREVHDANTDPQKALWLIGQLRRINNDMCSNVQYQQYLKELEEHWSQQYDSQMFPAHDIWGNPRPLKAEKLMPAPFGQ